ncbi:RIP metalloprotease RseP [Diaphorobacter sp. HDW4B]|uniref:RIP metalloprotease RseP n=1 Tax=Diaphorobacter sp. HDW4B TaxID=2714925 RepID=UPI0014094DC8|nr:RIP metalloprotease RseP [Diaphorobacter sp. HDW4B]QIL72515.1 RIP metalloprotease RseP [Diaphorobacter sp. HDW4B]
MLLTIVAFVVALGVLIAVHEYGHYRVAVACGVKVLRFSVGFGKPLLRWQKKGSPTEFVLAAFPLGGYVRMLDEREAPVAAEERHLAFNTQPLKSRAAIVAAGPLANLLLAVVLYSVVNWTGVDEAKPLLANPVVGSVAEKAGLQGGELVVGAALGDDEIEPVQSYEDVRWLLTRGALDGQNARLSVQNPGSLGAREITLNLASLNATDADLELFRKIGIMSPWTKPVIGEVMPEGAAARSGLKENDLVLRVGSKDIVDGLQLRELIRNSVIDGKATTQTWHVEREGRQMDVAVTPEVLQDANGSYGRIGAFVGKPPELVTVHYGFAEGIWKGVQRTWEVSVLTLKMMGRMVIGQASLKNLSGPLTIADYAGKSASMGLTQYLIFMALISVSLGVLNLLPLPVLDGGHLMYYLWEGLTGRGVSEAWMERLQRGGVAVLLVMMSIAMFNDVTRYVTRLFG